VTPDTEDNKLLNELNPVKEDSEINESVNDYIEQGADQRNVEICKISKQSKSMRVQGHVQGVSVELLVDTGASCTLVSGEIFGKLPVEEVKIERVVGRKFQLADGTPLRTYGACQVNISLGTETVRHEVIGADISDPGIIGFDFLEAHGCLLDLGRKRLEVKGVEVPCIRDTEKEKIQVKYIAQVKSDIIVPEGSEAVVEVELQMSDLVPEVLVLEPRHSFEEKYCLKMAAVMIQTGRPMFVRVMNTSDLPIKIYQGTRVADAEPVEQILKIGSEEDIDNMLSNMTIRKVGNVLTSQAPEKNCMHPSKSEQMEIPEYLTDLFKRSTEGMTAEQAAQVKNLLINNAGAFQKNKEDLGKLNSKFGVHEIPTGDAAPIKQAPRRTPIAFKGAEQEEIEKMLRMDVIRPSTSPWASPVVLVRKKDGSTRFCVDYTKLNKFVTSISYPLPRIDECIDSLSGATSFSSMDLACGYWQIPVKESDKAKTAFATKSGLYEFNQLPFGLTNAPSTFERCMEMVLRHCQWKTCLIYLDDIICFGNSFQQHLERLNEILQKLIEAGLKLKPSKCHFFREKLVFLGHMVTKDGVTTDPAKLEALSEWPPPKNIKDVRAFLGFCSYYRRYVKNFAEISEPIAYLTRKEHKFMWTKEADQAFQNLKQALMNAPILAYPQDEGLFVLDTDASEFGIGAVLSQIQTSDITQFPRKTLSDLEKKFNGEEKVISFGSRILTKEERNYCVTRKELLAIVYFLRSYRHYLLGRKFIIRTDHHALQWIFKLKDPTGQTARWQERLTDYDFEIIHRPGLKHGNADGMSRRPWHCSSTEPSQPPCGPCRKCQKQDSQPQETLAAIQTRQTKKLNASNCQKQNAEKSCTESWLQSYSNEDLQFKQQSDPDLAPVISWKEESAERPDHTSVVSASPAMRNLWLQWDSIKLHNGLLKKEGLQDGKLRLVVPSCLQLEVMKSLHENLMSGHLGYKRTYQKLSTRFYWHKMKEAVYDFITCCETCQKNKKTKRRPRPPMFHLPVGAPMDRISTDLFGPLPETTDGNKYILLLTDLFTKWTEIIAIPDATAETCANTILNEFISRFGCPISIHSDRGRNYEADLFKELCHLLQIKKTRTSPRHPQGNGSVERFNQTLITMIRAYLKGKANKWDQNLGCLAAAYRATQHESTGYTPNHLMLGREVRLPADLIFGTPEVKDCHYGEYATRIKLELGRAHRIAQEHLKKAAIRVEEHNHPSLNFKPYSVGDVMLVLNEKRLKGQNPKLQMPYEGPTIITEKKNDLNYVVQLNSKGQTKLVHYEKIKPFNGSVPLWITKILKDQKKQSSN
jgi:transposase InsO family protein